MSFVLQCAVHVNVPLLGDLVTRPTTLQLYMQDQDQDQDQSHGHQSTNFTPHFGGCLAATLSSGPVAQHHTEAVTTTVSRDALLPGSLAPLVTSLPP
ncbi:hypothetical protein E2C01_001521 [Portunus trituberculatus]|uniref:Uncharacterized protein n=1 Tax=Portunus trituberculatus TaxID=210409 RepID=A0A5B7CJL8_PORTR|nr:hypothetical protein [Portunus trituberculatus]